MAAPRPLRSGVGRRRARSGFALALVLLALAGPAPLSLVHAATATLDQVDVQRVGRELLGIRDGGFALRIDLLKGERVVWLGARGTVGVALTDRRFLAFSPGSAGWQEARFGRGEDAPEVLLAANLAVCITDERVLSFASLPGVIRELPLSPNEVVVAAEAEENVAAIVTSRRVLGMSADRPNVSDRSLFVQEQFESLRTSATSATVRTTMRLLVFKQSGGGWFEERY